MPTVPLRHSRTFSRDLRSSAAASSRGRAVPPHTAPLPRAGQRRPPAPAQPCGTAGTAPGRPPSPHQRASGRRTSQTHGPPRCRPPPDRTLRRCPSGPFLSYRSSREDAPRTDPGAQPGRDQPRVSPLPTGTTALQRGCRGGAGRARAAAPPVPPRTRAAGRARLPRRRRGRAPHKDGRAESLSRSCERCPAQRWRRQARTPPPPDCPQRELPAAKMAGAES